MRNVVFTLGCTFLIALGALGAKKAVVHVIDQSICNQCGECIKACKQDAVKVVIIDGKKIHEIDPSLCTQCGECIDKCPNDAIKVVDMKDYKARAAADMKQKKDK
jgi:ferredoxin